MSACGVTFPRMRGFDLLAQRLSRLPGWRAARASRPGRRMRVLIAVTHLLGAGHLTRAAAIARAFGRAGHDVTLVSGGRPAPHIALDGVRLVQTPPVRTAGHRFFDAARRNGTPRRSGAPYHPARVDAGGAGARASRRGRHRAVSRSAAGCWRASSRRSSRRAGDAAPPPHRILRARRSGRARQAGAGRGGARAASRLLRRRPRPRRPGPHPARGVVAGGPAHARPDPLYRLCRRRRAGRKPFRGRGRHHRFGRAPARRACRSAAPRSARRRSCPSFAGGCSSGPASRRMFMPPSRTRLRATPPSNGRGPTSAPCSAARACP